MDHVHLDSRSHTRCSRIKMPVAVWACCHRALGTAGPQVTRTHVINSSSAQRDGPLGRQWGRIALCPLTEGDRSGEVLFYNHSQRKQDCDPCLTPSLAAGPFQAENRVKMHNAFRASEEPGMAG